MGMTQHSLCFVALLSCIACHRATHTYVTTPGDPTHPTADPNTPSGGDPNTGVPSEELGAPRIGSSLCIIKPDRTLWCWQVGDLGSGWVQVAAPRGWLRFDLGVGIQEDGSLWQQDGNTLVAVLPDKKWREATRGADGICAIDAAEELWCQTKAGFAQVGNDTRWAQVGRWEFATSEEQVHIGASNMALDTNGRLFWLGYDPWYWGPPYADSWELYPATYSPPLVEPQSWTFFSQGCGIAHSDDFNQVRCFGQVTSPVSDMTSWTAVSGTYARGCAITQEGTLWCWGDNAFGEAGSGQADTLQPSGYAPSRQVGDSNQWLAVGVSLSTTCGYQQQKDLAQLYCWGINYAGQVAEGPHPYVDPNYFTGAIHNAAPSWRAVSSGAGSTCAVGEDTSLWCWGLFNPACALNGHCNAEAPRDFPIMLTPFTTGSTGWLDVRISIARYPQIDSYACGLRQNVAGNGNDVWCWGQGLNAAPQPTSQVAPGENWSFFGKPSAGLTLISADGNNLTSVNFDLDANDTRRVWRIPNPTAQGRWIDASLGVAEIAGIWRDETVQPATQHVYKKDRLFRDAMTLKYTGDWAHIGTLGDDGRWQSCGIKVDGTLWCGKGEIATLSQIQTANNAPWTSYIETDAGGMGVQDGRLWLVGSPNDSPSTGNMTPRPLASGLTTLQSIDGRGYYESMEAISYCGIYLDTQQQRQLTCWGWGNYGELGINDGAQGPALYYATPQPVPL